MNERARTRAPWSGSACSLIPSGPLSARGPRTVPGAGDTDETPRLPALPLQALLPLPLPGRPGLAYLLILPRPEAPGWRRRSSLEVDEAKPPSLTTTNVDSDSSNRPPTPRLAPQHPGAQGESHTPSLFWFGRGAYPPPQSLQLSCLPCK